MLPVNCTLRDVSILIVTYKGDDLTRDCLSSLASACGDGPQVVVVDNSPSEATRAMVAATFPSAVYVRSPENPGFAGGNNRGLRYCNRPYVLLLNNDTIVHSAESILSLARFLCENPRCGAVQGSGRLVPSGNIAGCGSWLTPLGFLYTPGFNEKEHPLFEKSHPCFMVSGFFLMFRRKDIASVGGFLFRTDFWCYYEETDFCHRVWLAGMEVWYVPTVPIDHFCGRTAGRFRHDDIMRRYLRNLRFSLKANLSFPSRLRMMPCIYLMIAAHAFFHLLKGHLSTFKVDFAALVTSRRDRKRILAARRQANRIRKVSDAQIFKLAMRTQTLKEFFSNVRGNM